MPPTSAGLPTPATAGSFASRRTTRKRARVHLGLSVHWANFRRRLGTGTAPSTSSHLYEVKPSRFLNACMKLDRAVRQAREKAVSNYTRAPFSKSRMKRMTRAMLTRSSSTANGLRKSRAPSRLRRAGMVTNTVPAQAATPTLIGPVTGTRRAGQTAGAGRALTVRASLGARTACGRRGFRSSSSGTGYGRSSMTSLRRASSTRRARGTSARRDGSFASRSPSARRCSSS